MTDGLRGIAEGALIALNNAFDNNKSGTSENKYINAFICQSLKIKNCDNISATLPAAVSPLSPQVVGDVGVTWLSWHRRLCC